MYIAVDSGPLSSGHSVRGIGFYTSELLSHLSKQRIGLEKVIIDEFDFSKDTKYLSSDRYDIVHFTNFNLFQLSLPYHLNSRAKRIVTIHDVIPLIYPEKYPSGLGGKLNLEIQKYILKNIDAVITVSETSKKDIVRFLNISDQKVFVTYEAPREIFTRLKNQSQRSTNVSARGSQVNLTKKYNLPKKFVLYVGDVNYNKNIPVLIESARLAQIPLVIVGKQANSLDDYNLIIPPLEGPRDWYRFVFDIPHPEVKHFQNLYDLVNENNVITPGFVSDEELVEFYKLALVYIQPSLYEGFGLPILEAMATGTPTIIAKTQCLVEVAEGASLIADPTNPADFAQKIRQIVENKKLHENLISKGYDRVKNFNWNKTAQATARVYKKLLT